MIHVIDTRLTKLDHLKIALLENDIKLWTVN